MSERWRGKLGALSRAHPDETKLRRLSAEGPRMPEPATRGRSRALAGGVAIAIAVASFAFLVGGFDGDRDQISTPAGIDPVAVCEVPPYDPGIALLVGNETIEVSLSILDDPGRPAAGVNGPGAEALRAYLASPAAVHAPQEGWRALVSSADAVTFAAPSDSAFGQAWWVVGFERQPDDEWRLDNEEIVDQQLTPAQRGHGLHLRWEADLVLRNGTWNDPLQLVNTRASEWTDVDGEYWAAAHVFDQATGQQVANGPSAVTGGGGTYALQPGEQMPLPVALGGSVVSLPPGTYAVVGCVPQLGLASPIGLLQVMDDASVPDIRVLTYQSSGAGMMALGGGKLTVYNGCLAVGSGAHPEYVVWPEGYALVRRDDRTVLIGPTGTEIGALGEDVLLGGGYSQLKWVRDLVIGGVPDACETGGEGYFITSGPASSS